VITKEYPTTNGDSSTRIGTLSAPKRSFLMVNGGLIMVNSDFTMVISENLMISYGVAKNKHVGHKNADEADEGAKIEYLSNKQYITSVCLSKTMFFFAEKL